MAVSSMKRPDDQRPDDIFYDPGDPQIDSEARELLTKYSKIQQSDLVKHVRRIRDAAWEKHPYPCIGLYKFLDLGIANTEQYAEVLVRVKHGETLLDVGCCFGHAIRKLIFDGAPARNVSGLEVERDLVELGFELFGDRYTLESHIWIADIFAMDWATLPKDAFDIIHAGAFFHLFTWAEQEEALLTIFSLLKRKKGSMIFGRQSGANVPGQTTLHLARSGEAYRHNPSTFKDLVHAVAKKVNLQLYADVSLLGTIAKLREDGCQWKSLSFCITVE